MNALFRRGLKTLGATIALAPWLIPYLIGPIAYNSAPEITDKKELKQVFEERAQILGIDPDSIDCKFLHPQFSTQDNGTQAMVNPRGDYDIRLRSPTSTRVIDEELFHIYAGHLAPEETTLGFSNTSTLTRLLIKEPQAIWYALTGIKLNEKEISF